MTTLHHNLILFLNLLRWGSMRLLYGTILFYNEKVSHLWYLLKNISHGLTLFQDFLEDTIPSAVVETR
jgi:hypothetical protein